MPAGRSEPASNEASARRAEQRWSGNRHRGQKSDGTNRERVATARNVERTYLLLTLLTTLAASFIWGINTLFLLSAGLNNTEAFAANAFFSMGQVLFEVPTGVVADTRGRRTSFLLGTLTLMASTALYLLMWQQRAPFVGWAAASVLLGLGFTFFSGATDAWLVDALTATGFRGDLETVFGRAQSVGGVATLVGSVGGGVIAQLTNLGVPYALRAALLGLTFVVALFLMHDIGFSPARDVSVGTAIRTVARGSVDNGLRNRPVRWLMLAAPFSGGVGFYAFYALQPYLLQLYGDPNAYSVAGLAAAIIAGSQILGGLTVSRVRRLFRRRTDALLVGAVVNVVVLVAIGWTPSFALALLLMAVWAMAFSILGPMRSAFINGVIPSEQRATVLSFDSLMGSVGGVVSGPALGRVADVYGYGPSYLVCAVVDVFTVPFVVLARRERAPSDPIDAPLPEAAAAVEVPPAESPLE
jgi:MFS family permease